MIKFKSVVILLLILCVVFGVFFVIATKCDKEPYNLTFVDAKIEEPERDDIITNMQTYMYKTLIEKLNN